jgi:hypothetical protein
MMYLTRRRFPKDVTRKLVTLRIGDELIEPGFPAHKRAYVGPIGPYGEDVVDPAKGQSARLVHFVSIPNKEKLIVGERGPENQYEQMCVQARARAIVAHGVVNHPAGPNCEHISSFVRNGNPTSPQLTVAVGVGVVALLVCLFN